MIIVNFNNIKKKFNMQGHPLCYKDISMVDTIEGNIGFAVHIEPGG